MARLKITQDGKARYFSSMEAANKVANKVFQRTGVVVGIEAAAFYRIDGGGDVEHLSERGTDREGYALCGARSVVGAWVSDANERITEACQLPSHSMCKRCTRIAFPKGS